MIGNFLGHFEKPHIYVKTTFWTIFGKIGLLFTPTSYHTANKVLLQFLSLVKKRKQFLFFLPFSTVGKYIVYKAEAVIYLPS